MKKEKIAKVQLIIGILLLIAGFMCIFWMYSITSSNFGHTGLKNHMMELVEEEYGSYEEAPLEIKLSILSNLDCVDSMSRLDFKDTRRDLASMSLILIVLSLLFITQGLVNKAKN